MPIKKWQNGPEAVGEYLRQSMIGMISIFRCTTNFIHVPNGIPRSTLGWKSRGNLRLFFGYVKTIESVEQCKPITLPEKERFPFLP